VVLVILVVIVAGVFVFGISDGWINPKIRVACRESLVGKGYVFRITNAGSKPLFNVTVASDRWRKPHVVASVLKPGDSVEAGWLELPEPIKKGVVYSISADGYLGSVKKTGGPDYGR
jgi:hypothetical protein